MHARDALVDGVVSRRAIDYIVPSGGSSNKRGEALVLHPVSVAINGTVATDCSLSFVGGRVGKAAHSEVNRTQFGLWVLQSQADPPPRVACRGFGSFPF